MFDPLSTGSRSASRPLLASLFIHCCVVGTMLVLPLWNFQQLPVADLVAFLAEPPPAPVPPPPPSPAAPRRLSQSYPAKMAVSSFHEPVEIPTTIPPAPMDPPVISNGLLASGQQGLPGGTVAAGLSEGAGRDSGAGILPGTLLTAPPPPPPRRPPDPVGGRVQSSRLIHRVDPTYPSLAIRARVQGSVLLRATIDEEGQVVHLQVISGHPLLTEEALTAVRQWRYSPTLLNGEPIPVITTITVMFKLN